MDDDIERGILRRTSRGVASGTAAAGREGLRRRVPLNDLSTDNDDDIYTLNRQRGGESDFSRPKTGKFEKVIQDSDEAGDSAVDRYLRKKSIKGKLDEGEGKGDRNIELTEKSKVIVEPTEVVNQDNASLFDDKLTSMDRALEPIRTDPVNALKTRQRRLERLTATKMPEYHIIGQILSGRGIINDSTEGAYCRWKVDHGKAWEHIGGEIVGQTHVSYCQHFATEDLVFNHPIDLHFAEIGFQGWGAPRILVQCSRIDWHGRRLLAGYGFIHLPCVAGYYKLDIPLWRPTGSLDEELNSFYLGHNPALISPDPIYDSAWKERCRLVTVSAGTVTLELYVMSRNTDDHKIDMI